MIIGIGTDIVNINTITRLVKRYDQRFISKVYTPAEQEYCDSKKNKFQHYAVRFAGKEALLKALGKGLRDGIQWKDIEFINDDLGRPNLVHHGEVSKLIQNSNVKHSHVTFSHTEDLAIAFIILEE